MKTYIKRVSLILTFIMLASYLAWLPSPAQAAVDITSKFIDQKFRAAVYSAISKSAPAPIYDTDVASLLALYVGSREIVSLDGLQYFTSLKTLDCSENEIQSLPALPASLTGLWCDDNNLTSLPTLPSGLEFVICAGNNLTSLPTLPSSLKELDCKDNQLTTLPSLPSSLNLLWCSGNGLTSLPPLPVGLRYLICSENQLTTLPYLPSGLYELDCEGNKLPSLPALPSSVYGLWCSGNLLTSLPTLPDGLTILHCFGNDLAALPALPSDLEQLDCSDNRITLTSLPVKLRSLKCTGNNLTNLPPLPSNLRYLTCSGNVLTSLPPLPSSLIELDCEGNQLTSLPVLPSSLRKLVCSANRLANLDATGLSSLEFFDCSGNLMPNEDAVTGFSSWDGVSFIFHPQQSNPVPAAPTSFITSAGEGGIKMKWVNEYSSTHAEDRILIERKVGDGDFTECASIAADLTSWIDTAAQAGETYVYRVWVYSFLADAYSDYSSVSAATMPGSATGSMGNFTVSNVYIPGMFVDVDEDEWYGFNVQKVIARVYEYGLMEGSGSNIFNPKGNMSVAEAITIAARVHNIYNGSSSVFEHGSIWYQGYVNYAIGNGIIDAGTFAGDYDRSATRAEMALIFSRSIPSEEFGTLNTVNALPDVGSSTPYHDEIALLYKAGVLTGNDAIGTFAPDANIIRAQAAAIIARVILPAMRAKDKTFG